MTAIGEKLNPEISLFPGWLRFSRHAKKCQIYFLNIWKNFDKNERVFSSFDYNQRGAQQPNVWERMF